MAKEGPEHYPNLCIPVDPTPFTMVTALFSVNKISKSPSFRYKGTKAQSYRVGRVPWAFSQVVQIGSPHPQASVAPLASEGAGGANSDEGTDTLVFLVKYNPSTHRAFSVIWL